ncbi:MAG: hypothetical protein ACYDGS_08950 [Thermoleophilia bacterium]
MYQEKHKFSHFPFEGSSRPDFGCLVQGVEPGPLFPFFIDADFSTFEGFLKFAEDHGLEGFQKFDSQLNRELERRRKADEALKKQKPIERAFLEKVWLRISEEILREQKSISDLYEFQKQLHKRGNVDVDLERSQGSFVYSPPPCLLNAIPYLNKQVHEKWETDVEPIGLYGTTSGEITVETLRGTLRRFHECDSIVARCYAEIVALIKDGRRVKKCALCEKPFIAKRSDARFCSRPFLSMQGKEEYRELLIQLNKRARHELREGLAREERAFLDRHSCRKVGPQITFQTALGKDEWAFSAEYKKLHSKKSYYKKAYGIDSQEYQKACQDFEKLKKNKPKKKKGARGKNG